LAGRLYVSVCRYQQPALFAEAKNLAEGSDDKLLINNGQREVDRTLLCSSSVQSYPPQYFVLDEDQLTANANI